MYKKWSGYSVTGRTGSAGPGSMITTIATAFKTLKDKTNKVTKIVLFSTHAVYHFVMSYSKLLLIKFIYIPY